MDATNGKGGETVRILVADRIAQEGVDLLRGELPEAQVDIQPGLSHEQLLARIGSYTALVVRSETQVTSAILAAAENGLPIFEYSPTRIKQSTVGRGGARKNQVAFMIRALLGLTETPDPDSADALAIALTHLRSEETARFGIAAPTEI